MAKLADLSGGIDIGVHKKGTAGRKRTIIIFALMLVLLIASVFFYIYSKTYAKAYITGIPLTPVTFKNIMARAVPALYAMSSSAVVIAVVSLSFQTITESRLLTPSMIGFDSLFVGTQTVIVFFFGSVSVLFTNPYINYLVSASVMVVVSMLMFGAILRKNRNNIIFLLMFGMILSGIVRSVTTYLRVIMDPDEFINVTSRTTVTVNNINSGIISLALPIMLAVTVAMLARHKIYDVLSLGVSNAKSLGTNYEKEVNLNLILIAVGMSVSTALIGSLTFLGLLAVNISREIFKTYKHWVMFLGSGLLAAIALILGQAIVELLQYAVPVTTILDLVGCSYMFYLILKENKKI